MGGHQSIAKIDLRTGGYLALVFTGTGIDGITAWHGVGTYDIFPIEKG
jgi:hypothetical protein